MSRPSANKRATRDAYPRPRGPDGGPSAAATDGGIRSLGVAAGVTADDLRASKKAGFVDDLVETGDADADRERVVFERAAGRLKAVRVL